MRSSDTFFVAGRKLGAGLLFATILAANIGAGSTVGAAGLGYSNGLAGWWWVGSAGIGTLLLAWWLGPRIWRVARAHDLNTVGDYLELRYGASVRLIIALLLWLGTLAILAGQLIAVAWILEVVAGVPKLWGCLIGGIVMTVYFTAGGLFTSAWVNLVELVVLLSGLGVALPWVLIHGGWQRLTSGSLGLASGGLSFWHQGSSGWPYLALLVPAFLVSPGLLQKVYGAHDERAVRRGVGLAGIALLLFAALPPLLGMLAHAYAPNLSNPELALPTVLLRGLPPSLGALGLAAVFSAELSSADAILFMLATSLSEDLYRRFLRPEAGDRTVLAVARWAALAGGVLGVGLSLALPSVIGSLSIFYSLLGVSLFVPVVAGLHSRKPGVPEALAAIAGGVVLLIAARTWPGAPWRGQLATAVALAGSALAFAVSYAWRKRMGGSPG